ncbi:MAG: tripartite tricarboxylate transporter TctB family protein [Actinomycetaceae bacterium]|nr:tripartite tricarboxylate transporter TctB family protein [Actinomycetaceae bacterium]MDY5854086.1 tripartite tricarboxylate transporter TctB family protein [Arcanobacterium sp.]
MKRPSLGNAIAATLILVFVIAAYISSFNVLDTSGSSDPGPAAYPRVILAVIGICALGMYFIRDDDPDELGNADDADGEDPPRSIKMVLAVFSAIAIYIGVIGLLGYIVATAAFTAVVVVLAGERKPLYIALYSIIFSVVIYFIFNQYLGIVLPEGLVEGLF